MPNPQTLLIALAIYLASLIGTYFYGRSDGYDVAQAEYAQRIVEAMQRSAGYLKEAHERLAEETDESARLQAMLAADKAEIDRLERENANALRAATDGRVCLRDRALGLLNPPADPGGVSEPDDGTGTRASAPAAGGTAADPDDETEEVATDTDVALWINSARAQYRACAKELNTWVTWRKGQK